MDQDFALFPEQASTHAPRVDGVFFFILAVLVFFTVLIAVMLLYFGIRYRRRSDADRPKPIEGSLKLELFWTLVPLGIALFIFYYSASVYFQMITPPPDTMEVYVIGKQWMWQTQHAGGQRETNQLHVPLGRPVKLT